jgi:hypothetical protein
LGAGPAFAVAGLAAYVLTNGGYFGSWRLGLGPDRDLGRSAGYGLLASLALIGLAVAVGILAFLLVGLLGGVGALIVALLVVPLFAAFYGVMVAMMGVGMLLMGLLVLLFGAALGNLGGGFGNGGSIAGAFGLLVVVPLGLFILWLTARLSCVAPAMASQGGFNLLHALGESWRLTGRAQLRIMLYLALVGTLFGIVYLLFAGAMAANVGMSAARGDIASFGIGTLVFGALISIVTAYVSVIVPAGIYRSLQPDVDASAAVFE